MLGLRLPYRRTTKDEAEKPFWISFSDMMTALMVLFLVVMTVTLLAVTHTISQAERMKTLREADISKLMAKIREASRDFPGITLRGNTIDFGDQARFDTDSNHLTPEQARHLRAFVPSVLKIARNPLGKKWLKRVIVEGYADQRGTYLHNLDLSMQRSERVLCALLAARERATGLQSNERGCDGRLVVYASPQAHSSVEKAVKIAGLGRANLRFIEVDARFAMRPDALAREIARDRQAGRQPCFVSATVGTTSSNAFDPLPELGRICREQGLWLHVDGAMCGTAALCPEFRHIHDGLELADSYSSIRISGCSPISTATASTWRTGRR